MKKLFFTLLILCIPQFSFAENCYIVAGAGTPAVDGVYYSIGDSSLWNGGTPSGVTAWGRNASTTSYALLQTVSTYYELVLLPYPWGTNAYYYDSAGGAGSFLGINSTNVGGTNPVPKISYKTDCVASSSTPGVNATTTTTVYLGEAPMTVMFYAILLWLIVIGCVVWFIRKFI